MLALLAMLADQRGAPAAEGSSDPVAPKAPHSPFTPARRDKHTYDDLKAPRLPSFNERDVSDNPPWIRKLPRLSDSKKQTIDNKAEKRAETLQAVELESTPD